MMTLALDIPTLLIALGVFFISRGIGGIISEYWKVGWFGWVHPEIAKFLGLSKKPAPEKIEITRSQLEAFESLEVRLTKALEDRDELHREVLQLRVLGSAFAQEPRLDA